MAKTGQEAPKTAPSLRGLQESPTTVYLSCLLVLHPPVSSVLLSGCARAHVREMERNAERFKAERRRINGNRREKEG